MCICIIILLCTWKHLSQLCFNKIYILREGNKTQKLATGVPKKLVIRECQEDLYWLTETDVTETHSRMKKSNPFLFVFSLSFHSAFYASCMHRQGLLHRLAETVIQHNKYLSRLDKANKGMDTQYKSRNVHLKKAEENQNTEDICNVVPNNVWNKDYMVREGKP